jgi:hypothetical protein
LTWLTMSGANRSSVGSSSACGDDHAGKADGPAPVVVGLAQRDGLSGSFDEAGLLGEPLRVKVLSNGRSASATAWAVGIHAPPATSRQRVVVQIAGHQHVSAPRSLTDARRGASARSEGLVFPEPRMQPRRSSGLPRPSSRTMFIARHESGPVLRQVQVWR